MWSGRKQYPDILTRYGQFLVQSTQLFVIRHVPLSVIKKIFNSLNPRLHAIMHGTSKSWEYTIYCFLGQLDILYIVSVQAIREKCDYNVHRRNDYASYETFISFTI